MTDHTPLTTDAGDMRRAAALIVHAGRGDDDGVSAVIGEAIEAKRSLNLLFALLELNHELVPIIYTEAGLSVLSQHVTRLAGLESKTQ